MIFPVLGKCLYAAVRISRRFLLEIDITHYTLIPYYDLTGQLVIAD
jgi:hypothetical protein